MFLERERSHKSADIRTFALISLLGAVFTILGATAASVAVKAGVTLWGPNRSFTYRVALWSAVVLTLAGGVTAIVAL